VRTIGLRSSDGSYWNRFRLCRKAIRAGDDEHRWNDFVRDRFRRFDRGSDCKKITDFKLTFQVTPLSRLSRSCPDKI